MSSPIKLSDIPKRKPRDLRKVLHLKGNIEFVKVYPATTYVKCTACNSGRAKGKWRDGKGYFALCPLCTEEMIDLLAPVEGSVS